MKNLLHPSMTRNSRTGASNIVLLCGILVTVAVGWLAVDWLVGYPQDVERSFVGGDRCATCHAQQHGEWEGSHHDLAMDLATESTVLGDFSEQSIEHYGITSRMFRDGDRFMVHTEGETGEMQDFQVKYVFGVEPLQQYMVEFDRTDDMPADEIARLQVLR
ncbi:MAG: hypothetical protein AAF497_17405, partial [Planctomycetota bacterium]